MGIVQRRTLWASDIRYMNDSAELRHTADLVRQGSQSKAGDGTPESGLTHPFSGLDCQSYYQWPHAICRLVSNQWQPVKSVAGVQLSRKRRQYRLKAKRHTGGARSQQFEIGKCIYDPIRQAQLIAQVLDAVEALHTSVKDEPYLFGEIESDLLRIAAVLKHPSFRRRKSGELSPRSLTTSSTPR